MLTDVLTHSFTQHMTYSSYAYSYVLIPFLVIDYKASIVLLLIPPSFYKYSASPSVYKLLWQSANASSQSPASKLLFYLLRCPYLSIVLYQFTSISPYYISESCRLQ